MGKKPQIAVLLANTGTPDDPSPEAVRRYLRDYLKDRRIVEMPPFIWLPILYGTVLRKRPAKSAAKYRQIWTPEGSPLVVHARKIAEGLNERMKASDLPVRVEYSMCYGNPSLDAQIRKIVAEGIEKLYPAAFPSVFSSDCRVCHGYRRQNLSDTAEHSGNENREAVL